MKQAYKEMGGIILAGMALVSLLVFLVGGQLLPELGKRMDAPGIEYGEYQDFAQTKAVCEREEPQIVRRGAWKCKEGEVVFIAQMFQGIDANGNQVDVEVTGIWDEGKNSRMGFYQKEERKLAGLEKGAYLIRLRAVDGERKSSVKHFFLLVEGSI